MATDTTTVTITRLEGAPDELLHIYPNQQKPQDCFISLDLRAGEMRADYNAEIGNAVPSDVWHGIVRRYTIPVLQPATANELMEKLVPFAQRVLDGSEIAWDGSNHVARFTDDASEAEDDIETIIEAETDNGTDDRGNVYWWDAQDWLAPVVAEVRQRLADGESVDALYDEYQGDGSDEDHPVVDGLMPYLETLRDLGAEER